VTSDNSAASHWNWLPDLLAFGYGLAVAWLFHWQVKDLIWSLWLCSLTVGYTTILLSIFGPIYRVRKTLTGPVLGLQLAGALFVLAFFTVHFGMFHFGHSFFLNQFFPVVDGHRGPPSLALYRIVLANYWPFILAAVVSERVALRQAVEKPNMMAPYVNVIRMHLLIFFFAGAAALKLQSFVVYVVVFSVYFFPFRFVRSKFGGATVSQ